ncbi:MAG: hypothetical protein EAS52_02735 [Parapedobacter sp.]|nr:MAG: hypothetical protein EAS52_02735 [Parapedobacter sp.]
MKLSYLLIFPTLVLLSCRQGGKAGTKSPYVIKVEREEYTLPGSKTNTHRVMKIDTIFAYSDAEAYQQGYIAYTAEKAVVENMSHEITKRIVGFEVLDTNLLNLKYSVPLHIRDSLERMVDSAAADATAPLRTGK